MRKLLLSLIIVTVIQACSPKKTEDNRTESGFSDPTISTLNHHKSLTKRLPFDDDEDYELARKGLIAETEFVIRKQNQTIWNSNEFRFLDKASSDSVNPSLWRQAQLNNMRGLFKVTEGIYQLRGFDLANMTIIEGDEGWIIVDPLSVVETASEAISFARQHLGEKPIKAIIFTHSHIDHFGGAQGIVSAEQAEQQNIAIIAPEAFIQEATSENIIAGVAMSRRASYMYGKYLPKSERGYVGNGLGKGPVFGTFSLLEPTIIVKDTGTKLTIDGVEMVFQMTPETEAPAEFTFYLPKQKAFCGAELLSRNMHNLYTLRGAKTRDALKWSYHIDEASRLFSDADVYFGSHHWPIWGNEYILEFMEKQRDIYKFIHDQTVRLFNHGLTGDEIAEQLKLPDELENYWPVRGYHGSLKHNVKAVYNFYMGWYNGNPATLDQLPSFASAAKYVSLMGGAESVITEAQQAFDKGEYRWAAELLNHLIFADQDNESAKQLLAKTYDQLGYQSEAGSWRNNYLSAAYELRHGKVKQGIDLSTLRGVLEYTSFEDFFTSMATRLNAEDAAGLDLTIRIHFSDKNESFLLRLKNSVLHYSADEQKQAVDATLTLTHKVFLDMMVGKLGIKEMLFSDELSLDGSTVDLLRFLILFDKPDGTFPIVTP